VKTSAQRVPRCTFAITGAAAASAHGVQVTLTPAHALSAVFLEIRSRIDGRSVFLTLSAMSVMYR